MNILHITPHLSTGGLPEFLYNIIKTDKINNLYCLEYQFLGGDFNVQRNKIKKLLNSNFFEHTQLSSIDINNFDIIYLQEIPEYFMSENDCMFLYNSDRKYKIIESSHDSSFSIENKKYFPDCFGLIADCQEKEFKKLNIPIIRIELDFEKKEKNKQKYLKELNLNPNFKHVINVGIFSPRKNQKEFLEYAKYFKNEDIVFHFVGVIADNFIDYHKNLINEAKKYKNIKIWGQRNDVYKFYNIADLFIFTSKGNTSDKETKPLVIKEASEYNIPTLIYNLDNYNSYYDKYDNIQYLSNDFDENIKKIKNILNIETQFEISFIEDENKYIIETKSKGIYKFSIRDINSSHPMYCGNLNFGENDSYWVTPCGKDWNNQFDKNNVFSGFYVEIYNQSNKLLYSKEFPKKEKTSFDEIISSPFINSCINYYQFFVDCNYDFIKNDLESAIDIGANCGISSDFLIKKGAKKLYLIDADKRNVKFLKNKYKENKNINIIHKTVSGNDIDYSFFYEDEENTTISSLIKDQIHGFGKRRKTKVENITLDHFFELYNIKNISIIKIDIEGEEYNLIKNTKIETLKKSDYYLIELHCNESIDEYYYLIRKFENDFNIQIREEKTNKIISIDEIFKNQSYILWCEKKHKENISLQQAVTFQEEFSERHLMSFDNLKQFNVERNFYNICETIPHDYPCLRHNNISDGSSNSLTSRHFGCFSSIRDIVLNKFNNDYLIVFESDSYILDSFSFLENLEKIKYYIKQYDINYFSLAGPNHFQTKELLSPEIETIDDFCYITNQCYYCNAFVIHKKDKDFFQNVFQKEPWDTPDLFLKHYLTKNNKKICVTREPLVVQCNGESLIDREFKKNEYITY